MKKNCSVPGITQLPPHPKPPIHRWNKSMTKLVQPWIQRLVPEGKKQLSLRQIAQVSIHFSELANSLLSVVVKTSSILLNNSLKYFYCHAFSAIVERIVYCFALVETLGLNSGLLSLETPQPRCGAVCWHEAEVDIVWTTHVIPVKTSCCSVILLITAHGPRKGPQKHEKANILKFVFL